MILKIRKLHEGAEIPRYAHDDDAGMDLFCFQEFELKPKERKSIPTGISVEIPKGYVGLVWDKSGLSHKYGIKSYGGVIDAGFRGELHVGLMNLSDKKFKFEKGHKIAQMLIQKVEHVKIKEVKSLSQTKRGEKWLGSTGK